MKVFVFSLYQSQRADPSAVWRVPEDTPLMVTPPGELLVGGVYLRLFVANPGWMVRRPKEFLSELMDSCLALMSKEKRNVSLHRNFHLIKYIQA